MNHSCWAYWWMDTIWHFQYRLSMLWSSISESPWLIKILGWVNEQYIERVANRIMLYQSPGTNVSSIPQSFTKVTESSSGYSSSIVSDGRELDMMGCTKLNRWETGGNNKCFGEYMCLRTCMHHPDNMCHDFDTCVLHGFQRTSIGCRRRHQNMSGGGVGASCNI